LAEANRIACVGPALRDLLYPVSQSPPTAMGRINGPSHSFEFDFWR
jgi:hypothetical protein